jgi:hypothetical protein
VGGDAESKTTERVEQSFPGTNIIGLEKRRNNRGSVCVNDTLAQ